MGVPRILVVCTANVCRSPMGAALLQHQLDAVGVAAVVTSAGTSPVTLPVDPVATEVLAARGIDISAHRPRMATKQGVATDGADLVIAMTRAHLRVVATTQRDAFFRTFTLRELSRRHVSIQTAVPAVAEANSVTLAAWTTVLSAGRRPIDLLGDSVDDDIADPYGMGHARVAAAAADIDQLIGSFVHDPPWSGLKGQPGHC